MARSLIRTLACTVIVAGCGSGQESADTPEPAEQVAQAATPAVQETGPTWDEYCLGGLFRVELPVAPARDDVPQPPDGGFLGWEAHHLTEADSTSYLARSMWKPSSTPGTYEAAGFFEVLSRNRDIVYRTDTTFGGLDAVRYQFSAGPGGTHRSTGMVVSQDTILYLVSGLTAALSDRLADVERFLNSLEPGSCPAM